MLNMSFFKATIVGALTLFFLSSCNMAIGDGDVGAPVITKQPVDISTCVSEKNPLTRIEYTVEATGSNLSYQWFLSDGTKEYTIEEAIENLVDKDESILVESKDKTLSIYYENGIDAVVNFSVYVVVSNEFGSVESDPARFDTVDCSEDFAVSLSDQTVMVGDVVTFEPKVLGASNVSYQWFYFDGKNWIDLGASGNKFVSPPATLAVNGFKIKVVVYDKDNDQFAEAIATLTVKAPAVFGVDLPDVKNMDIGHILRLEGKVYNAVGKITYEWFVFVGAEFQKINGATESFYNTAPILEDTKFRFCATDDVLKQTVCDSAMVTIKVAKPFGVSLNSVFTIVGANATFSGFAENGTAPYVYEWYEKDGSGDFVLLAGETALTLDLGIVEIEDNARQFRFCATDAKATKLCADAGLTVEVPEFKVTLNDYTTSPGNRVDFKADVKYGTAPFTYGWYRNGSLLEGKSEFILTLDSVTAEDNGAIFKVCVTDSSAAPLTLCDEAFLYVIVK